MWWFWSVELFLLEGCNDAGSISSWTVLILHFDGLKVISLAGSQSSSPVRCCCSSSELLVVEGINCVFHKDAHITLCWCWQVIYENSGKFQSRIKPRTTRLTSSMKSSCKVSATAVTKVTEVTEGNNANWDQISILFTLIPKWKYIHPKHVFIFYISNRFKIKTCLK